ncbi:hypothetical protein TcWFU_004220 [Taenia crassiceps]|uniref:MYND-type domain-containing protein n=1 Tax=Taenia crassiceps TaxID=6207 RepID=A0ABR4QAY3_9CEST
MRHASCMVSSISLHHSTNPRRLHNRCLQRPIETDRSVDATQMKPIGMCRKSVATCKQQLAAMQQRMNGRFFSQRTQLAKCESTWDYSSRRWHRLSWTYYTASGRSSSKPSTLSFIVFAVSRRIDGTSKLASLSVTSSTSNSLCGHWLRVSEMAVPTPAELCDYRFGRCGGVQRSPFLKSELGCYKAKNEIDNSDELERAKETMPKTVCDAVDHSDRGVHVDELRERRLHGFCVLKTASHGFIGTYWRGLRHGFGISLHSGDNLFMGFYEGDKCSGLGIYLRQSNEIDIGLWKANSLIKASTSAISCIRFFESPLFTRYYSEVGKLAKEELIGIAEVGALPLPAVGRESFDACIADAAKEVDELPCFQSNRKKDTEGNQEFETEPDVPFSRKTTTSTLCLLSCAKVLSRTPFSVAYLAKICKNEVKSKGPITGAVESLYRAAEDNDLHSVRETLTNTLDFSCRLLINQQHSLRLDVNVRDCHGITPLHVASANQSVEVVDFLLSYGADANALTLDGMSPITICVLSYLEKRSTRRKKASHLVELGVGLGSSNVWSRAELVWLLGCDGSDPSAPQNDHEARTIHSSDDEDYIETNVPELPETVPSTGERVEYGTKPPRFDKYMSCNQYLEALTREAVERPTPGGAATCKSKRPCAASTLTQATQVTQTHLRGMQRSIRFRARLKTTLLLLQYGADPNIVAQPLPPLIAAARAGDVELSRLLLHFGADPNIRVARQLAMTAKCEFTDNRGNAYEPSTGGLTALHFAVVLPGETGVELTQTLLQGGANATLRASPDASFLVDIESDKAKWPISTCDSGRTALHLACARTYDRQHSLKIVQLLMDHGADPNLLCNGQCALSLALTCSNDEIVSLLLTYPQTKAGMGLTHGLGSPLCLLLHPVFEHLRSFDSRLALLAKLLAHCSSGLLYHRVIMPHEMVEGNIVDYIHHAYAQVETQLLGDPAKRQILHNRHQILTCLATELRKAAFASEMWQRCQGLKRTSSAMQIEELQFCFHCGRSVRVNLSPCRGCGLVLFCSNSCRRGAWLQWHARQCAITLARRKAEKVATEARKGLEKHGSQLPVPSTRNGHPAHCYGFYKDRIYMTKEVIERLLEEDFSSPGNYSFL